MIKFLFAESNVCCFGSDRIEGVNGVAQAVWEWTRGRSNESMKMPTSADFGVVLVAAPGMASLGEALVEGSLAPIESVSDSHSQSLSLPVPRFLNPYAPIRAFVVH
jgi:hypothetical protein